MSTQPKELAKFQEDGQSLVLHYNLPQPTVFTLQAPIALNCPPAIWAEAADSTEGALSQLPKPINATNLRTYLIAEMEKMGWDVGQLYLFLQEKGFNLTRPASTLPKMGIVSTILLEPDPNEEGGEQGGTGGSGGSLPLIPPPSTPTPPAAPSLSDLWTEIVNACLAHQLYPQGVQQGNLEWKMQLISQNQPAKPCLLVIEEHAVTSQPGIYGAGKTVGTFSLLPDEETEITIRTFKKTELEQSQSSSVVDSLNSESENSFQSELNRDTKTESVEESSVERVLNRKAGINATINLPLKRGNINVTGEIESNIKRNLSTSLTENVQVLDKALRNQSTKVSSKREVTVNTNEKYSVTEEYENKVIRKLKNVNMGRTLNFVFRQLVQQYVVVHHLTNVKFAFWNGYVYEEASIETLRELLDKYVLDGFVNDIYAGLTSSYIGLKDYQAKQRNLFEVKESGKLGLNMDYRGEYHARNAEEVETALELKKPSLDEELPVIRVQGIILKTQKLMMPTDSVIVDCVLGRGEGLDPYALAMQLQEQREATLKNDVQEERIKLAKSIQESALTPSEKVKLMKEILTDCCPQTICGCSRGSLGGGGLEDGN